MNCLTPFEQVLVPMARLIHSPSRGKGLKEDIGRNKLIINHLGRLFVTSDAATIIRELEVVHPAAKLLVMASQAQEAEVRGVMGYSGLLLMFYLDGRRHQHGPHICR